MKYKTSIILILIMSVYLAACGSTSMTPSESSESAENQVTVEQAEEAVEGTSEENAMAEGAISKYLTDGKMSVGIDKDVPTLMYIRNDDLDGLGISLINEISKRLNTEIEIKKLKSEELLTSVGSIIDICLINTSTVLEDKDSIDVTDLCCELLQEVLLPSDSEIKTRNDMFGKTIGCMPDTEAGLFIDDLCAEDGTTEKRIYTNIKEAIEDLQNGEIDALIVDQFLSQKNIDSNSEEFNMVDGSSYGIENERYAFAIPKGDIILTEQINTIISEMKSDGTIDRLIEDNLP